MNRSNPNSADPGILAEASEALAAGSIYSWVWEIPENRFFVTHAALAHLFAVDPEKAAGGLPVETFAKAIHDEDREQVMEAVEKAVAEGAEYAADYRVIDAEGRLRWVAARGKVEYSPDGQPLRLPGVFMDVTERKRAEETLRRSERRFRRLSEHAADAAFVHDLSGNFVEVNDQACRSLGYSREELLSMRVQDVERNLVPGGFVEIWQRGFEGEPVNVEGVHRRKDGAEFPVEVRVGALEGEEESLILAMVRDITERQRTETALKRSENRYRSLAEATNDYVWLTSADGRLTTGQPGWSAFSGQSFEQYRDFGWLQAIHADDRERVRRSWLEHVRLRVPIDLEYRALRADGAWRDVHVRAAPVPEDGGTVEWVGVAEDITSRKDSERRLRESESRYKIAADTARWDLSSWTS